jgi:hypothetical protein
MGFDIRQKRNSSHCLFMPPSFRVLGKDGRSVMPVIHRHPVPMAVKMLYYLHVRWTHSWLVAEAQDKPACPCARCEVIWGVEV